MRPILLAMLAALPAGTALGADASHALRGVFCKSEAQLMAFFDNLRGGLGPRAAVEIVNRDAVLCVYADRIDYVVARPVVLGQVRHAGRVLVSYEATLTGVRVGGNLRAIEPPMPIFFVQPGLIEGSTVLGKA